MQYGDIHKGFPPHPTPCIPSPGPPADGPGMGSWGVVGWGRIPYGYISVLSIRYWIYVYMHLVAHSPNLSAGKRHLFFYKSISSCRTNIYIYIYIYVFCCSCMVYLFRGTQKTTWNSNPLKLAAEFSPVLSS